MVFGLGPRNTLKVEVHNLELGTLFVGLESSGLVSTSRYSLVFP